MLSVAILCGGLGTRLYPLTRNIPKSLIPINGEPFITHQLRLLKSKGVERVVLCIGHLGYMIRANVGDGHQYGLQVEYSEAEPKGTAHAIRHALPLLGENFFVLYGDSYLTCDYAAIAKRYEQSILPVMMTVFRNRGRWETSNVELNTVNGNNDYILTYSKSRQTPRMQYVDYGLSVWLAGALNTSASDLTTIFEYLAEAGLLGAYEVTGERFYEAGSMAGIRDLEERLKRI